MPAANLHDFAAVNDRAAATTKKLQKQQILGEYFRAIQDDDDLRLAVRYSGGRAFAATDERVLGTSGAIVSDVILTMTKIDPGEYHALIVRNGEIGEALAIIWEQTKLDARGNAQALTLKEVAQAFEDLAATGNVARKKEFVRELFSRCTHPREAAYLAKIIFSDLRTGVREGVLHDAIALAFETERKLVQQAQLMVGDLGEVAVLARHRQLEQAKFQLFHPIQFMLATPQETAEEAAETMAGRAFFAEDKLDGIRAQVHKSGEGPAARIAIYTRTMDRTDESFPDVVEAIRKLPGDFLLDGEIVPYRNGRVLPFAHIQKRLGRKALTAKIISQNPAVFIAFDMLHHNSELLMDKPLRSRRERLHQLAGCAPKVEHGEAHTPSPCTQGEGGGEGTSKSPPSSAVENTLSPTPSLSTGRRSSALLTTAVTEVRTADEIEKSFCFARDCGNEGLVLKDPDSLYSPGRRGQAWLKLKTHLPTLDCVVTAAEYGHGKRKNVLSDYTFAVWDKDPQAHPDAQLVNIGKAYSGVTDEEIKQLTEIFMKLAREQHWGRVFIVEPKIVLEIACDQIQPSDRHASGYALRFPRIKRIRWDKGPIDADRLARVEEIYQSVANTARREQVEAKPTDEATLFDGI
jgi:DNA ligase-1